ncbi:MAG: DUF1460 domain-containing protein [Ignavibacteria bacterium]|nr:DUF1460 domain-containing protein [Ignavibacteria bacterium]
MTKRRSDEDEGSPTRRWFLRQIGLLAGASVVGERTAARAVSLIQNPPLTDEQICSRKFELAVRESLSDRPIGEVMVAVGSSFLGTPYKAHTLEVPGEEHLVVNLRALDCVTFVENVLALSRCIRLRRYTFEDYLGHLKLIRYRAGEIDGYPSRLHYFSDWIGDNEQKGIVKNILRESGGVSLTKKIRFMTAHRDSYRQLSDDSVLGEIRKTESALSNNERWYLPKEELTDQPDLLRSGDIVGITTSIEGLDIVHTGIVVFTNGSARYLHAPLSGGSVQISDEPLAAYLQARKSQTGIMAARPLDPQ